MIIMIIVMVNLNNHNYHKNQRSIFYAFTQFSTRRFCRNLRFFSVIKIRIWLVRG